VLLAWGPFGVFLLAILDSAGIPLPGGVDALLVALGYQDPSVAFLAAALAVAGSAVGSLILFYLARRGGEAYLSRHTVSRRSQRFLRWFQDYGLLTIFIPALLPIPLPLKVFVIAAGAAGISPWVFLVVITVARVPRYFGLAYLGSQLGPSAWPWLKSNVGYLMLLAVALFVGLYLLIKLTGSRRRARRLATES
jgi:membrane protein DedA with SNARE-associated domain